MANATAELIWALFSCHYKPAYQSWYNIFLSQQISRTNQRKRLIDQPNRAQLPSLLKEPRISHDQRPCVGVFGPPTSKFVFARLARMVCSEDTRVYIGSGETSLRLVRCYSCYRHLVCSRGYKQAREGEDPKSLVEGVNGC